MAEPDRPAPAADAVAAGALAVAAATVLLSLFLRWARVEGTTEVVRLSGPEDGSGWELLTGLDIVLALTAAEGLALALVLVSGARIGVPALALSATGFAIALGLVVRRARDPPLAVVAGQADVVAALGPYLAMAGLASMVLAAAIAAVWRT